MKLLSYVSHDNSNTVHCVPVGTRCVENKWIALLPLTTPRVLPRSQRTTVTQYERGLSAGLLRSQKEGTRLSLLVVAEQPGTCLQIECRVLGFLKEVELQEVVSDAFNWRLPRLLWAWKLEPESTLLYSGSLFGRPLDFCLRSDDVPEVVVGRPHKLMTSSILITGLTMGSERLEVNIHHYSPGGSCEQRSHKDLEQIYYVLGGSGCMQIGVVCRDVLPGTLGFVPRNTAHAIKNTGNEELSICFVNIELGHRES